jgi:heat-inducible transcriptional repressor
MVDAMLEERRAAILRAVVEEYIATAQPVGSSHIASAPGVGVSPATVRNEMMQLEKQGYLHQPHTSAGRVPTEKGYRFFVDNIAGPGSLGATQSRQVRSFFETSHGELERLLTETTQLLSNLTDCAAVVVAPPAPSATVRSIQLVRVGQSQAVVVAVLSNGSVEKATVDLHALVAAAGGPAADLDALVDDAAAMLGRASVGSTLQAAASALDEGGGRAPGPAKLAAEAVAALLSEGRDELDHVYVGGASRMAAAFEAIEQVRQVLAILEHQLVVVSLIRDVLDRGLTVAIGSETGVQPLAECSLIVAPFEMEGEAVGTIGVLGPTRMNYPQALTAVAVVSQHLGDRLSES